MRKTTSRQRVSSNPLPSDILLTLPDLGIDVHKVAKDEAWSLCPNPKHADRSPSWSINLTTGEHNCFACGWGGNYLMLVEHETGLDTEQAEAWVRKRGGIDVARKKLRGEQAYTKKQAEEINEADLVFFDAEIPGWALRERDLVQESCERYGVMWDPKKDQWIFPIRDVLTQQLLGWQAKGKGTFRNVPDAVEKATAVFGYHLLGDTAYVEESPADCVRLDSYQVEGAVSGFGVHISDFQMEAIIDHPKVKRVVMCLDNDRAGRLKEAEIWNTYRSRTRLYFANYDGIKAKDHGEMTPEEIAFSLDNAISALRFRP
jgi:DNA primase